jgi:hypothetical protein
MALPDKLLGARLKLKRANKHIRDLDIALKAFKKSNPQKVRTKRNKKGYLIYYVHSLKHVPAELCLIAGDALNNLRAALDHTIMQLWMANGGASVSRIMFPTADTAASYRTKLREIKRLGKPTIKALCAIQAYNGGNGHHIWLLNKLNNTDKHRLLLTIAIGRKPLNLGVLVHSFQKATGKTRPPKPVPGLYVGDRNVLYATKRGDPLLTDMSGSSPKFNKHVKFPIEVAFNELGVPGRDSVVKTLTDASKFVADVIDQLGGLL